MSDSVGRDARRGLRWLASARAISVAFNTVASFLTIRLLEPEDFGLAAAASMLVGYISLLNDAGLATSLIRAPTLDDSRIDRTHGLILIINVAAYSMLALVAPFAQAFFGFQGLTSIVLVAGLQLLIYGPIAAPSAILQRRMRFPTLASATVAEGLIGGASTVLLALNGAGVWSLVVGPLVGGVARVIVVLISSERIPRPRPSLRGMSEALRFGGTLTAGQLIWAAYSRADTIVVGRILGNEALGLYSVAMQVATLPMERIAGILNSVGLSAFASVQNQLPLLREKYLWVTRTSAGVVFPVFWGISAIAHEITNVVLGPKWGAAALPLMLVSLPVPLRFLSTITEPVLLALGRADLTTMNVIAATCIMVPAFLLGSHWGLVGVSSGWLVGYTIFFSFRTLVALRAIGIPTVTYWRSLLPAVVAAALMFLGVAIARAALDATDIGPITRTGLLVVTGIATYAAATWSLNRRLLIDVRSLVG